MAEIPLEICREILLRLPVKFLIRFKTVCKSWREIIEDPSFVKAHTNNQLSSNPMLIHHSTGQCFLHVYFLDLENLNSTNDHHTITATPISLTRARLPGSSHYPVAGCDGLMLVPPCRYDRKDNWNIWNPFTHEHINLPEANLVSDRVAWESNVKSGVVAWGFGCNHATNGYEAVLIDSLVENSRLRYYDGESSNVESYYYYQTHVYSLKLDSWRKIMSYPYEDKLVGPNGAGVFLSGVLHWISGDMIIVLDLRTERYGKMELPPLHVVKKENGTRQQNHLDVLSGYLIVSDYASKDGKDGYRSIKQCEHFDVWVMKDYGVQDSWVKLFSLDFEQEVTRDLGPLRPVAFTKNKMQVLLHTTSQVHR